MFEAQFDAVSGLLGDTDGDPANGLVNADTEEQLDTSDPLAPSFVEGLYESGFGEPWRIEPEDSMLLASGDFDQHGKEARSWAKEIVTLETFLGPEVEEARDQPARAGDHHP